MLAKLLANNKQIRVGLLDTDLNQSDPRFFNEGSIPLMKLFVKGDKNRPRRYEGPRQVQDFLDYIQQNCGDVSSPCRRTNHLFSHPPKPT
jgi:hypothetical protein